MLSIQQAQEFRQSLLRYLAPDENGDKGGTYGVASLYFDSPDLRCYWEKINGIRFRRKLRIRRYQTGVSLTQDSPVFVEVKQRLNRVTQKRRLCLPFRDALDFCLRRHARQCINSENPVEAEILSMCYWYDLRPASVVMYNRQALVGSDLDIGLRVTFDRDLRYRTHDLDLANQDVAGYFLFPPDRVIMEIKVNERAPYWLTELAAKHNLNLVRVSKYCRSIEAARMDGGERLTAGHKIELPLEQPIQS
jgi:SPX domain protein involved in polyphosphate accumulation